MYTKLLKHSKKFLKRITVQEHQENVSQDALHSYISEKNKKQIVVSEISLFSALKIIGILVALFVLWEFIAKTADIIISLFFSIFLASVLYPSVSFLENKKIPRVFSILISFLFVFLFLGLLFSSIIPAVIDQSITLGNWFLSHVKYIYAGDFSQIPTWFQSSGPQMQEYLYEIDEYIKSLQNDGETQQGLFQVITDNISKFKPWQDGIITIISSIFSSLFSFLLVIVLTFFMLLERDEITQYILKFFSPSLQKYLQIKQTQMQQKISGWIHGQMVLFLFMGGITWAFFSLLGVEYAITIGFIAGVAEFIPYLGPLITLCIGAPLAFGESIEVGIAVLVFFGVMQFIEGNILIPIVMEKAVGISAIVAILALLIGFQFLGIIGAIIAIPLVAVIGIFVEDVK